MEVSPVGGRGPGGSGAGGPKEQPPHRHSPNCGKKPNWETIARTAYWYAHRLTYEEISAKLHIARETVHHQVEAIRDHMQREYGVVLPGVELRRHLVAAGCADVEPK